MTYTVVIPNFNREDQLILAVNSILKQTLPAEEIIIVDDSSSQSINYKNVERLDHRVKIITHLKNSGVSAARNTGYKFSSTEKVLFLDSDDLWHCDKARTVVLLLNTAPVVVNGFTASKENFFANRGQREGSGAALDGFFSLIKNRVQGSSIGICKKQFTLKFPFNGHYRFSEDYEFFLRCRKHKIIIKYHETPLTLLGRPNSVAGGLSASMKNMRLYERYAIRDNISHPLLRMILIMISHIKEIRKGLFKP